MSIICIYRFLRHSATKSKYRKLWNKFSIELNKNAAGCGNYRWWQWNEDTKGKWRNEFHWCGAISWISSHIHWFGELNYLWKLIFLVNFCIEMHWNTLKQWISLEMIWFHLIWMKYINNMNIFAKFDINFNSVDTKRHYFGQRKRVYWVRIREKISTG